MQLQIITKGDTIDAREKIKQIDNWQLELIAPKNFDGSDTNNYIKSLDISFENLCTSMEELGVHEPGKLTVFQFYTKLIYFEKKKNKNTTSK